MMELSHVMNVRKERGRGDQAKAVPIKVIDSIEVWDCLVGCNIGEVGEGLLTLDI